MRSLAILLTAAVLVSCSSKIDTQKTTEEAPPPANVIAMGDVRRASQLLGGFSGIEAEAWRWTAKNFQVRLGLAPAAAQKARLKFDFSFPQSSLDKLGPTTLTASQGGQVIGTYDIKSEGPHSFETTFTPSAQQQNYVEVTFSLSKAIPPSGAELRELGVVATRIELLPAR
jgi:hypothetical protein